MDIKQLLSNIDSSVLTEESKSQICDVFETVVTEKVSAQIEESVTVKVQEALVEQDESHSTQLNQLLEAIDADHSKKLTGLVGKLDEEYTAKLEDVVKKYEVLLSKEAKSLTESLQVDISNFLDLTLDDLLPQNMLKEAVDNTKAAQKLKKIQELISVDESFINENVREALEDGRIQIESLRKDLNGVLKDNVRLGAEKSKVSSDLILERKSNSLPSEKRLFVESTFKGKSASYIEENFDVALKMFERKENQAIKNEKAQVLEESVATKVDTPKEVTQQSAVDEESPQMSEYVSGLK